MFVVTVWKVVRLCGGVRGFCTEMIALRQYWLKIVTVIGIVTVI